MASSANTAATESKTQSSETNQSSESNQMSEQTRAERAAKVMLANDQATRQLGITVESIAPGSATLCMRVVNDMLNGHGSCHGGFLFTLGDSAFAFACNSYNQVAVAASASIEFLAPVYLDDVLTAEASMQSQGRRTGLYDVVIRNQDNTRVALFRGRSQRLGKPLFDEISESE